MKISELIEKTAKENNIHKSILYEFYVKAKECENPYYDYNNKEENEE